MDSFKRSLIKCSCMKYILSVIMIIITASCSRQIDIEEAVQLNNSTVVNRYLTNGGNPNAINDRNESLLYLATGPKGGHDVLKLLLDNGANPDLGFGKYTPLMNAASWVSIDGVKILIEAGANPNIKNEEGQTALQCVGNVGGDEREVVEYLKSQVSSQ